MGYPYIHQTMSYYRQMDGKKSGERKHDYQIKRHHGHSSQVLILSINDKLSSCWPCYKWLHIIYLQHIRYMEFKSLFINFVASVTEGKHKRVSYQVGSGINNTRNTRMPFLLLTAVSIKSITVTAKCFCFRINGIREHQIAIMFRHTVLNGRK